MTSNNSVRFTQSCPRCGRRVEVRASLLGCTVACQHCHAEFVASTNSDGPQHIDRSIDLLQRVESALRRADQGTTV
ncbi:hypothetical protein Pla52o_12740 [Novipirellula galeiformis]|uniref:Uncharacterized protein n=1 Tax=Novipirellula galeiformis TaxID=2528004 RepID=A0A5C6CN22_9BACT|nr:hypothetical protein Pla52o_12740 [Novipirellula galeiformis]